jgi:hypothetical protein
MDASYLNESMSMSSPTRDQHENSTETMIKKLIEKQNQSKQSDILSMLLKQPQQPQPQPIASPNQDQVLL